MPTTIEAIYEHGVFRPKRPVKLAEGQEVELTIEGLRLHDGTSDSEFTALMSEDALGRIWNDPAEDEAWAHL